MKQSSSSRTFTLEIEVSNLHSDKDAQLDTAIRILYNQIEVIEQLLYARTGGEAAVVVTDETRRTDTADLSPF